MLYIAYCGYAEFLIVIIFITVVVLFIILRLLFVLLLRNFEVVVFSVKIINVGFFRDLEVLVTV